MGADRRVGLAGAILATMLVLPSCGGPEPYIYIPNAFDRDAPDFNNPDERPRRVDICYQKYSTSPQVVSRLANEECARGGRVARFSDQYLGGPCPLLTPVFVRYRCESP